VAAWKLIAAAMKAKKTLARIPPEKRRELVDTASRQVRTYGPVIARRIRKALDDFNKPIK
jgi:hypothetical protein